MNAVYFILSCLSFFLLIAISSIVPRRTTLSRYELQRRSEAGDAKAKEEIEREQVVDDIVSIQRVLVSLLLIAVALFTIATGGWLMGIVLSIAAAIFYGRIAKIQGVRDVSNKLYQPYDSHVVSFVRKYPIIAKLIRYGSNQSVEHEVASRAELEHIIASSGVLLTADEKKLLVSGLNFRDKKVSSVMTPRSVVVGVPQDELVGPLMLDELHKTGHSRFPVYDTDIDHIVGILHIRELVALIDKKSQTAAKAMDTKVYYIDENHPLSAAPAAFLKTRHHMFVVVNEYRETVGLLTLEDVIEELLGREIIDEYDVYDDLRAFAKKSAKANNNAEHGVDV